MSSIDGARAKLRDLHPGRCQFIERDSLPRRLEKPVASHHRSVRSREEESEERNQTVHEAASAAAAAMNPAQSIGGAMRKTSRVAN